MAKMRVEDGQAVYILEHRIPRIAKRKYPYDHKARVKCLMKMLSRERHNIPYEVCTHLMSRYTGRITVIAPDGTRYQAHHTDVIRM